MRTKWVFLCVCEYEFVFSTAEMNIRRYYRNESFTLGKCFSLEKWFDSGIIGQRMVCLCQKHCSIIVLAVCNGFNALSFTLTIQTTNCECQMTDQLWEVHYKIVNIERIIVWSTLIIFERGWWRERKKGRGGGGCEWVSQGWFEE